MAFHNKDVAAFYNIDFEKVDNILSELIRPGLELFDAFNLRFVIDDVSLNVSDFMFALGGTGLASWSPLLTTPDVSIISYAMNSHIERITVPANEENLMTKNDMIVMLSSVLEKHIPLVCPETGGFIGWKAVSRNFEADTLAKLYIPASAKRSSGASVKCRCDKAVVVTLYDLSRMKRINRAFSPLYDDEFIYRENKMVYPDSFDENRWHECTNGIHFYMRPLEAMMLMPRQVILPLKTQESMKMLQYYGIGITSADLKYANSLRKE